MADSPKTHPVEDLVRSQQQLVEAHLALVRMAQAADPRFARRALNRAESAHEEIDPFRQEKVGYTAEDLGPLPQLDEPDLEQPPGARATAPAATPAPAAPASDEARRKLTVYAVLGVLILGGLYLATNKPKSGGDATLDGRLQEQHAQYEARLTMANEEVKVNQRRLQDVQDELTRTQKELVKLEKVYQRAIGKDDDSAPAQAVSATPAAALVTEPGTPLGNAAAELERTNADLVKIQKAAEASRSDYLMLAEKVASAKQALAIRKAKGAAVAPIEDFLSDDARAARKQTKVGPPPGAVVGDDLGAVNDKILAAQASLQRSQKAILHWQALLTDSINELKTVSAEVDAADAK